MNACIQLYLTLIVHAFVTVPYRLLGFLILLLHVCGRLYCSAKLIVAWGSTYFRGGPNTSALSEVIGPGGPNTMK